MRNSLVIATTLVLLAALAGSSCAQTAVPSSRSETDGAKAGLSPAASQTQSTTPRSDGPTVILLPPEPLNEVEQQSSEQPKRPVPPAGKEAEQTKKPETAIVSPELTNAGERVPLPFAPAQADNLADPSRSDPFDTEKLFKFDWAYIITMTVAVIALALIVASSRRQPRS